MKMRAMAVTVLAFSICFGQSSPARAWDPLQKARRAAETAGEKLQRGDTKGAIENYARAQAYRPQDPDYRLGLGEALYADGDLKGAMSQFQAAANSGDPGLDRQALYNAGNVALAKKDPKTALSLYQKALLKGKPDPDLLHNLELAQRLLEQQKNQKQDQKQKGDQKQDQKQDQKKDQGQDQKQDSSQEQKQNSSQNQDQKKQQEDEQQNGSKSNQQQSSENQKDQAQNQKQEQPSAAPDSSLEQPARPDSTQTAMSDSMTTKVGVMSPAEAMRLLSALDHDEEELRRSIQRRLRTTENKSKHEW
jgi:Tfp pilus assembly protein PilF